MIGNDVLVIDDDRATRESLRMLLEFEGFQVSDCESGPAAIYLSTQKHFGSILIDFRMPDMNGDEVARMLRSLHPRSFIVGFSMEAKEHAFIASGADVFLSKHQLAHDLIPLIKNSVKGS